MTKSIVKKKPVKFIRRFLKFEMAIISFWILAGVFALIVAEVADQPIRNNADIFVIGLIVVLMFSLFMSVSTEFANERRTITKIEIESDILQIELLDFDRAKRFSAQLTNLEVTLSRSYRKGASPVNIDFWIMEKDVKKKLMRQHCNKAWKDYDVTEVFQAIKEMKNERLSKKERKIIENSF